MKVVYNSKEYPGQTGRVVVDFAKFWNMKTIEYTNEEEREELINSCKAKSIPYEVIEEAKQIHLT